MFVNILILTILLLSIIVVMFVHPLVLAFLLVGVSIITSILCCTLSISWFMYILILVFLGGVIVVILFMVSLCRNEQFFYNNFWWVGLSIILIISLRTVNLYYKSIQRYSSYKIIIGIYRLDARCAFLFMAVILLLCLFTAVNLSKVEMGPLVSRL